MLFRIHFSDGSTVEVDAGSADAARDVARDRKDGSIVTKVKVVREGRS